MDWSKLTFGSVSSGIEAASVAFHPLGWRAEWLAEIDPNASAVLAYRLGAGRPTWMPDPDEPGLSDDEKKDRRAALKALDRIEWGSSLPNYGDMARLPDAILDGSVSAPAMLCGGTPCQAFSLAGKRAGLADQRGNLTLVFTEILDALDVARARRGEPPAVCLWENVPGVLSSEDNAFGCFLAALAGDDDPLEPGPRPEQERSSAHWTWQKESGLHRPKWSVAGCVVGPKRAVAWRSYDAQYFGLAQRRERVIVIASALDGFDPSAILLEFDGLRRDSAPSREAWQGTTGTPDAGADAGGGESSRDRTSRLSSHWDNPSEPHPTLSQSYNTGGIGQSNQEIFAQRGAGLVPQSMSDGFRMVAFGQYIQDGTSSTIKARDYKDATDLVLQAVCLDARQDPVHLMDCSLPLGAKDTGHAVCVTGDITHSLTAEGFDASKDGTGRGNPLTVSVIPILEAGARTEVSATDPRAGMGVGQVGDPTFTLQSSKQHGVYAFQPRIARNGRGAMGDIVNALSAESGETGKGDSAPCVAGEMAVRRLLPMECERLQGFPDNWTLIPTKSRRSVEPDMVRHLLEAVGPEVMDFIDGDKASLVSDGPRYKQLGNSWPVPMIRWVGWRLRSHLMALDAGTLTVELDPDLVWAAIA